MSEPYISISAAARQIPRAKQVVQRWVAAGRVPARRIGGRPFVRLSQVLAYARLERPQGKHHQAKV